eukprot:scaffold114714_cov60-Phaeocystis_antarctica.AAC.1
MARPRTPWPGKEQPRRPWSCLGRARLDLLGGGDRGERVGVALLERGHLGLDLVGRREVGGRARAVGGGLVRVKGQGQG